MDDEDTPQLVLKTQGMRVDELSHVIFSKEFVDIFPETGEWSIKNISILLNELKSWKEAGRMHIRESNGSKYISILFQDENKQDENKMSQLRVHVTLDGKVSASVCTDYLCREWQSNTCTITVNKDSRGRPLKKPQTLLHVYYKKVFRLEQYGSHVILFKKNPLFYDISCFSDSFAFFCFCILDRLNKIIDEDITILEDIYDIWFREKGRSDSATEESFKANVEGFLDLEVTKSNLRTKGHIHIDDVDYSILSGIYISPYSASILEDNNEIVDGLLMDTTWHVLPYYVTSILMCSVCNVGIPLAFSFGKGETSSLYEMFFETFNEKFGIDLGQYTVESDNGIALTAVCNNHNNKHLRCLKHFLTSLGLEEFSKQVGELVSSKCIKDFNALCKIYADQFSKVPLEKMDSLKKILFKAGLDFCSERKEIIIADINKWDTISQIERIKYSMPSTTNALESSHGHLNGQLPRRNNFWSAMLRLVTFILKKESSFSG